MQHAGIKDETTACGEEIIAQLKDKFSTAQRSEKMQILTLLPKSWSVRQIETEFGASNYMARKAKELVKEKGVMSTPNPKPGQSLSQAITRLVTDSYENDENSRMMPGKKDCVSEQQKDVLWFRRGSYS